MVKRSDKLLATMVAIWLILVTIQAQSLGKFDVLFIAYMVLACWGVPTYMERWEQRQKLQFDRWLEHATIDQVREKIRDDR